ncbi:unnamed protein product [Blepharisma stoltei]|nr:unnamed protein product [Blepharisma stoltei]
MIGRYINNTSIYNWLISDVTELKFLEELGEEKWEKIDFLTKITLRSIDDKLRTSRENSKHKHFFEIQNIEDDLKKENISIHDLNFWRLVKSIRRLK